MPDIDITAAGEHVYDVSTTDDSGSTTTHRVTVPQRLMTELGLVASQEPVLVRASMHYLLDREPASSVLASFGLDDITRYFPGYPDEIVTLL